MSRATRSRALALEVLLAVADKGAYANLELPRALGSSGLEERDRAFATELVYGSLRAQGELDAVISAASARGVETLEDDVLAVLRMGVYQLLRMRVESHAAVDESVRLIKARGLHRAAGLVNGVLRAVARDEPAHWESIIAQGKTVQSHPLWIVDEIKRALEECDGEGELGEALDSHNDAPGVTLCHLPGLSRPPESERTEYSPVGAHLSGGDPGVVPGIQGHTVRVQDEGSQLAALLLTRCEPLRPGERVWDMCAGPGGKTALIAAEAAESGASVLATEISDHRAKLVADSTSALREKYPEVLTITTVDARADLGERFDRVLLDAPCSGLGALRRRPEARWSKSASSLAQLNQLQGELLRAGLESLVPGGVLAYVTCSPVVEETTGMVSEVLASRHDAELLDTGRVLEDIVRAPIRGHRRGMAVQLWTHRHGTDGMFIQLIQRKASVG